MLTEQTVSRWPLDTALYSLRQKKVVNQKTKTNKHPWKLFSRVSDYLFFTVFSSNTEANCKEIVSENFKSNNRSNRKWNFILIISSDSLVIKEQ